VTPKLLLDTHIVIRWLVEPNRLSREQKRVLDSAMAQNEPVAISSMTLLEIAVLSAEGSKRLKASVGDLFEMLQNTLAFDLLPVTFEIAREVAALGNLLRTPTDRVIVATARVHRLRLVTADQLIIESNLVPVID
jgi:PIN domain nuclease of toxin-antitoxin system